MAITGRDLLILKKLKNTCPISKAQYKFQYTELELMFNHFSYFPESYNYTRAKTVGIVWFWRFLLIESLVFAVSGFIFL